MLSKIAYHDYIALVCSFDAEWSREAYNPENNPLRPFARVFEDFATSCWRYRQGMVDYAAKMHVDDVPAPWLFNPVCYVPFGHADALGVVLLDDCDTAHHLANSATTATESVAIGFCPTLESLGAAGDGLFCELAELIGATPPVPGRDTGKPAPSTQEAWRYEHFRPAKHVFENDQSLLVFSKFKMDGLGAVGPGLLFQQTLLRAMVRKARSVIKILRHEMNRGQQTSVDALIGPGELDATKLAIVNLLGAQEIGMFVFSSNFSIAASILAGLRSLTYGDLYEDGIDFDGQLLDAMRHSELHKEIVQYGQWPTNDYDRVAHPLAKLHAFRLTHSTAAVAWSAFSAEHGSRTACRGYVNATSVLQLAPGHRIRAERRFQEEVLAKFRPSPAPQGDWKYYRYLMGTGDVPFMHGHMAETVEAGPWGTLPGCPLLPLTDVIEVIRASLKEFGCANEVNEFGRDVIDCCTTLVVPVPQVLDDNGNNRLFGEMDNMRHFAPLMRALAKIKDKLFFATGSSAPSRHDRPNGTRSLNLQQLCDGQRAYGIPASLRRTSMCIFQEFATHLADPFLFDEVLDLYDTFATLHLFLTAEHDVPKPQAFVRLRGSSRSTPATNETVRRLSEVFDALHNALDHRTFSGYSEPPIRERATGVRGGLNQMLFAADVPVKCGLGLLRRLVQKTSGHDGRTTVAIPTKVVFAPGTKIDYGNYTNGQNRVMLGYLVGDVPHLLNVARYADHLHETFHAILAEISNQKQQDENWPFNKDFRKAPADPKGKMGDQLAEVFVMFLCQLFTCGTDVHTFRRYSVISFSKGIEGTGRDDKETVSRLTEWLIRLFLASDVLANRTDIPENVRNDPARWGADDWFVRNRDLDHLRLKRFKAMCDDLGPFLHDYDRLWNGASGDEVRAFADLEFHVGYNLAAASLEPLLVEAMCVYRRFINDVFPGGPLIHDGTDDQAIATALAELSGDCLDRYERMQRDIEDAAHNALKEGRAVIRRLCPQEYRTGEDGALDPLVLVCAMLREYFRFGTDTSAPSGACRAVNRTSASILTRRRPTMSSWSIEVLRQRFPLRPRLGATVSRNKSRSRRLFGTFRPRSERADLPRYSACAPTNRSGLRQYAPSSFANLAGQFSEKLLAVFSRVLAAIQIVQIPVVSGPLPLSFRIFHPAESGRCPLSFRRRTIVWYICYGERGGLLARRSHGIA